jgi:hypothetical protein
MPCLAVETYDKEYQHYGQNKFHKLSNETQYDKNIHI